MPGLKPHHKLILQVLLTLGGRGSYRQVADAHPDLNSNGVSQSFTTLQGRGLVTPAHIDSDPEHHGVELTSDGRAVAVANGSLGETAGNASTPDEGTLF